LINCVICNSIKTEKKNIVSRNDILLTVLKCKNCNHWWLIKYKDLYSDGTFSKDYRGMNAPTEEKITTSENTAIHRFIDYSKYLKKRSSILEIGSSFGSFIKLLKMFGIDSNGIEPDPIGKSSENIYGFKQEIVGIEKYKHNKKFNTIFSFHVIEHVDNPHIFIQKIKKLLRENGRLIIECPSLDIHKYGNLKRTIWEPHRHYYSISSLYWLLKKYYYVEHIWYRDGNLFAIVRKDENSLVVGKNQFQFFKYLGKIVYYFNRFGPNKNIVSKVKRLIISTILEKKSNYAIDKAVLRLFRNNKYEKFINDEKKQGNNKIAHITSFKPGHNAGDTVLSKNVRDIFNLSISDYEWRLIDIKDRVTAETIKKINEQDLCVIGGGGLFIPDTNANSISGWQWSVSIEDLEKISVPIIIFAVGFNYFHGQAPSNLFIKNVKELINKASFVGIRNRGSINQLKKYLNKEQFDKLNYQPCPTTLIRMMKNDLIQNKQIKTKSIAINIAFDRYHRRFGQESDGVLKQIALAMVVLHKEGFVITVVSHTATDSVFRNMLANYLGDFQYINLKYSLPNEIIEFYTNEIDLVIGMRGHSQMIPFGTGCKILTLGTHNKMKYFLDDISSLDLYIDLNDNVANLSNRIINKTVNIYKDLNIEKRHLNEQKKLFDITRNNLELINSYIE